MIVTNIAIHADIVPVRSLPETSLVLIDRQEMSSSVCPIVAFSIDVGNIISSAAVTCIDSFAEEVGVPYGFWIALSALETVVLHRQIVCCGSCGEGRDDGDGWEIHCGWSYVA